MPQPKVNIANSGGDLVGVTNNRLDVNAVLSSSDNIEIGNVDIKLNGTGVSADEGNADAGTIRVTIADDDNHWGAVGTASDKDGVAHGQLRYIGEQVEDIGAIHSVATTMNGHLVDINTNTVNTANFVVGMQDTHGSTLGTIVVPAGAESKVVDGDTLDNPVAEGKATRVAASRSGIQYMCLTDQLGLIAHPNATDDTAQDATPGILNVGGEYRASPTTYADGDATILQTNINGALNIAGTVDLGSTDNAVLDAMVVDLAAIEDLLITIDSDTDAIKTAVLHAISGSEMQVDVVAALPAGTNAIGKLSANSGVDIGDVDVTSLPASTNTIEVVGDAAEDAAVAGNPVLVGGRYDSSSRSLDDGDVGAIALTSQGFINTYITNAPLSSQGTYLSAFRVCGGSFSQTSDSLISVAVLMSDVLAAPANTTNGDWSALQVDTQGALYTTHGVTAMQSDNNEGVDDTTAEVLKSSTACKRVDMQADPDNTGYIYVGGSDVSATKGIRLAPGDFYSIDCNNTADIYVLASVDEEDIHFTYYT